MSIPVNPHAFGVRLTPFYTFSAFGSSLHTMHRAHFSSGSHALQNFKVDRYNACPISNSNTNLEMFVF